MFLKEKSLFRFLLGFALVIGSLSCVRASRKKQEPSTYIKAIYAFPSSFDPVKMNDTVSLVVSNLIYDGLLTFNSRLEFEGALAESWTVDKSGKVYSFKIREGAKFHDGSSITAEDAVRSLTRSMAPYSTVYKYYDCILGAEEYFSGKATSVTGLRVESPNTVVIELKYPFPPFLSILAGATAKILPKQADKSPNFFDHPIGSGSFKIITLNKMNTKEHQEIVLERFPQDKSPTPKLKTLILRVLSQADAETQASQGLIHDLANYPLAGSEPVFKSGTDLVSPVAATWVIGLNLRHKPFNDLRVRQAFKASVDSEAFRKVFYPDAHTASGYIPIGFPGHLTNSPPVSKLIPSKTPKHSKIVVAFPELITKQNQMREYLQSMLRIRGWDVTFVPMSWDRIMEGYNNKSLQAFVLSMNMDYPDSEFLFRNFETNNPDNFSGLSNTKMDALIRKARQSQDRLIRGHLYQELASNLEDLAVTINLFHPRSHTWVHRCVKNFKPNLLADYYIDYHFVELIEACLDKQGGGGT